MQHVGLQARQQIIGHGHLRLLAALHAGSNAGMASTLAEQEQADLRKGTWPVLIAGAGESGRIGRRVGHILPRAIQRHQPPSKAVGPRRLGATQGPTALGKESF